MQAFSSYFNPFSNEFHTIDVFQSLKKEYKVLICIGTLAAAILTIPFLGLGSLPAFVALTRKFSYIQLGSEKTGNEGQSTAEKTQETANEVLQLLPTSASSSSFSLADESLKTAFAGLAPFCSNMDDILEEIGKRGGPHSNLNKIVALMEQNRKEGTPFLSTKFGFCGEAGALSVKEMDHLKKNCGFAMVLPSEGSGAIKHPVFAVHDWKSDEWHFIDNEGTKRDFSWESCSDKDGVIFCSKLLYQKAEKIPHPKEIGSELEVAGFSEKSDRKGPPFYQEKQVGCYCGKHAFNALLGYHHFNTLDWQGMTSASGASSVPHVMECISPELEDEGHAFVPILYDASGFTTMPFRELIQSSDRFMEGPPGHWIAYRLDPSTGEWWCIDSLKREEFGEETELYQYVVNIEETCGKGKSEAKTHFGQHGLIVSLTVEEAVHHYLRVLELMKGVAEDKEMDFLDKIQIWNDRVCWGLNELLKRGKLKESAGKIKQLTKKYGLFLQKYHRSAGTNADEVFGIIEQLKEELAKSLASQGL